MRRTLDVLGVYLLPLCCFALDYALDVFWTALYPLTLWSFGAAGMIAFALSNRAMSGPTGANIAAGALLIAATGAGLAALPFYLAGAFGVGALLATGNPLFALYPLLTLVPVLTVSRLATRARAVMRTAPASAPLIIAGTGAILLPVGLAFRVEVLGDEHRKADLLSGDRDRVLHALANDSWYGPRDIMQRPVYPAYDICGHLSALPLNDPEVDSAAQKALQLPPNKTVREFCNRRSS